MLHLLTLEWKKYWKNTLVRIVLISYVVFLPAILFIGKKLNLEDVGPLPFSNNMFYEFPTIWKFLGYTGNWISFFVLGFLALYIITGEYGNKTFRQNIITGVSRSQFFFSKLQLITVISLFATLYFFLSGYIIGQIHTEAGTYTTMFEHDYTLVRYFLMCMGYMSFAMFLGIVIRKSGIALILYFSYVLVIELILRWLIHLKLFKDKSMHFYPMNSVEDLMPIPFSEAASGFIREFEFSFFLTSEEAMVSTCIYTLLFLLISYRHVRRADL